MGFKAKHMDGTTYWHASTAADGLDQQCGGTGMRQCTCGGDQCFCGNFGEAECFGCPDCEGARDDDGMDYDDYDN